MKVFYLSLKDKGGNLFIYYVIAKTAEDVVEWADQGGMLEPLGRSISSLIDQSGDGSVIILKEVYDGTADDLQAHDFDTQRC